MLWAPACSCRSYRTLRLDELTLGSGRATGSYSPWRSRIAGRTRVLWTRLSPFRRRIGRIRRRRRSRVWPRRRSLTCSPRLWTLFFISRAKPAVLNFLSSCFALNSVSYLHSLIYRCRPLLLLLMLCSARALLLGTRISFKLICNCTTACACYLHSNTLFCLSVRLELSFEHNGL